MYDRNVPASLKTVQEWFGRIITQPIDIENRLPDYTPSGNLIKEEARSYINPSPTLRSHQRIELYSQQYWWRLLTTLHETFELTVRLFGYYEFNQKLAFPYLQKYPPHHWSLNKLGKRMASWIEENYHEEDKELVITAALQDWAIFDAFTAPSLPLLQEEDFCQSIVQLQPHVFLCKMRFNLFEVRKIFLKETPEYWESHDFPTIPRERTYFHIIYRCQNNIVRWCEMDEGAFFILQLFQKGCTLDEVCQALENQNESLRLAAEEKLQTWFQDFMMRGLLTRAI